MATVLERLLAATDAGPVAPAEAAAALARGQALLDAGDRDGAAVALRIAAVAPATQLAAHHLIEQHQLAGSFGAWMGLDADIDPADDMYRFFTNYGTWSSPLRDYLADGWRTLSELMLLLERNRRSLAACAQVLEFASGHGRFTRHLVKALGAEHVTVSDVVAEAVQFSTRQFGVRGFVSAAQPAALEWPARWDLVFVLSLFTHLPADTWQAWLEKIWQAVAPGGLLVLTTHGDAAIERAGVAVGTEGFFFHAESESRAIDTAQYGVTYTRPAFVRARLQALQPAPRRIGFEPAWFWSHQDAWVLQRPDDAGETR